MSESISQLRLRQRRDYQFVNQFGAPVPELLSDEQLLKMAALLHDCYQSIDLAYHLLLEHDRRRGKQDTKNRFF